MSRFKYFHNNDYHTLTEFLLAIITDACWLTWYDVYLMVEHLYEDISGETVRSMIYKLHKAGYLKSRPWPHTTPPGYQVTSSKKPLQYLRVHGS